MEESPRPIGMSFGPMTTSMGSGHPLPFQRARSRVTVDYAHFSAKSDLPGLAQGIQRPQGSPVLPPNAIQLSKSLSFL